MTTLNPPEPPTIPRDSMTPFGSAASQEPVSTLRGPSVGQVNVRRIGQLLAGLTVVVVPGDPALLAPVPVLAGEHTSSSVFILPVVLFVVLLLLLLGGLVLEQRHRRVTLLEPAAGP